MPYLYGGIKLYGTILLISTFDRIDNIKLKQHLKTNMDQNMINNGQNYGGMHFHNSNGDETIEWDVGKSSGKYIGKLLDDKPHGEGSFLGTGGTL